jgi:hypothetical protein
MKLFEKMRQQKLLSTTLMLFTLSLGIVIGTLLNTGVHAQRGQAAAPDATPLTIPKATAVGNEFTKLATMTAQICSGAFSAAPGAATSPSSLSGGNSPALVLLSIRMVTSSPIIT